VTSAALIALDWGTSNLRASLLDHRGEPLETRSAAGGVMAVKNGAFAAALRSLCGDWLAQCACPLIASGMVGSRQGWKEAPYVDCPASMAQVAALLTTVQIDGVEESSGARLLHIVPGLRCVDDNDQYDVMRGEETQLWGADLAAGSICVLPGTHSKWAWLGGAGEISRFATFMTGELYGLLTQHGILGRLMVFGQQHQDEFVAGARLGLAGHARLSHTIFAARTAGLMQCVAPDALPDFLSGILIGAEVGAAGAGQTLSSVCLLGDDDLCARYALACEVAGISTSRANAGATTTGQWRVARAAGLLKDIA
jgi:2-dehydro-3-deoxygalactonokinase